MKEGGGVSDNRSGSGVLVPIASTLRRHCSMLVMLNDRLDSDKYPLLNHWFDSARIRTPHLQRGMVTYTFILKWLCLFY